MPEIGTLKQVTQGSISIASVTSGTVQPMKIDVAIIDWHGSEYHGEYEVTPSAETQTLATQGKNLEQDIVINPIPSNYGLITWNGSTLTVS